ncbi:unnamed protein product, partial [Lampetra planeri]
MPVCFGFLVLLVVVEKVSRRSENVAVQLGPLFSHEPCPVERQPQRTADGANECEE